MNFSIANGILTLFFVGEINSGNAVAVEKDAMASIGQNKFEKLVLDFSEVTYISSAGLRIILKIKQTFKEVSITNASLEVYDVLNMTGFTNIMPVAKALREVDVTGKEIIGEGFFSTVYRIDKDTIVKVFNDPKTEYSSIQRELNLAKEAFVLGIPTAISFDIVKVGNLYGVRFELLDSCLLRDVFRDQPGKMDEEIKKYAQLLKKINTTETEDQNLPKTKDLCLKKLETIKHLFTDEENEQMRKMVEGIPDRNTFVHGDCHFKNIMVQNNELFLIDMDTLSKGHPIFELAAICAPYILFEQDDPGNNLRFFGLSKEVVTPIYEKTINEYFGKDDDDIKGKIMLLGYMHMVWWTLEYQPDNSKRLNHCKAEVSARLKIYKDFDIGI
ncbi:MAG: STAS domain-containing protein [Bacilli bacterium]|nr:STAS domain-containing protein [Bacilli bacterium]